jgi:nucleoside 2-deoxyribosyltransferase
MKIYMICPVRNASPQMRADILAEVEALENQGHSVYYPARDTQQEDPTGLTICKANRAAIESADEIHVIWDGESTGSIFDLGIAFALRKKIVPVIGRFPQMSQGKSIQNIVYDWQEHGAD